MAEGHALPILSLPSSLRSFSASLLHISPIPEALTKAFTQFRILHPAAQPTALPHQNPAHRLKSGLPQAPLARALVSERWLPEFENSHPICNAYARFSSFNLRPGIIGE